MGKAGLEDRLICVVGIANDTIEIREKKFPDATVNEFIASLDEHGRKFYRHQPNAEQEIQWFAMLKDRIIGYGSLSGLGSEVVFGCAIHQDFRGKGLGKVMYGLATDLARRHKKAAITAEQDDTNDAARSICEDEGFEFSGPFPDPESSSGRIVRLRKEVV